MSPTCPKHTYEITEIQIEIHFACPGGRDARSANKTNRLEENASHHVNFKCGNHLEYVVATLLRENLEHKKEYTIVTFHV